MTEEHGDCVALHDHQRGLREVWEARDAHWRASLAKIRERHDRPHICEDGNGYAQGKKCPTIAALPEETP